MCCWGEWAQTCLVDMSGYLRTRVDVCTYIRVAYLRYHMPMYLKREFVNAARAIRNASASNCADRDTIDRSQTPAGVPAGTLLCR